VTDHGDYHDDLPSDNSPFISQALPSPKMGPFAGDNRCETNTGVHQTLTWLVKL
jgi:hypothetical protein